MTAGRVSVDVSAWESPYDETLGAREKTWLTPAGAGVQTRWLFKLPRSSGLPEPMADLWAELLACRIAALLTVPAAEVRLARRDGLPGVISRSIGDDLVHGNELLSARNLDYDSQRRGRAPGYTLEAIAESLVGYRGSEAGLTAFESFAGYLVFDALIANTDRHHENWAVRQRSRMLAPTYDHGAALGFNVPPRRRDDVDRVARDGRSRHFADGHDQMPLVELAGAALELAGRRAADLWLKRVERLDLRALETAIVTVPHWLMSEGARTFVLNLVETNRRRLLQ